MITLPWAYDAVTKKYTVGKKFYRIHWFLTIAFFVTLVSISFFGG